MAVDPEALQLALINHVKEHGAKRAFALHQYQFLSKDRAVHGRSLHLMAPLVAPFAFAVK